MHLFCSGAAPRNGCTATYRVQCPRACGGCGGCRGCGGLLCLSCLPLGLSSAWVVFRAWVVFCLGGLLLGGSSVCWAWVVFCLGLCGALCCGSSEMSHAIPRHVCQTLKSHRWNCNVLGRCTKFGYPNYVRVLVDEAPQENSCVRSSSHDTVHNPRDTSNTTPTPQNAKSPFRWLCWSCSTCLRLLVVVLWLVFVGGLGGITTIGAALRRVVGVSVVYGRKTPRVVAWKGQRRVPFRWQCWSCSTSLSSCPGGVACVRWWLGGNYYHRRCLAACRRRVGGLWSQNPPSACSKCSPPR